MSPQERAPEYNRRGEPIFARREGETPEQAAERYRREHAESPAGRREAAQAALRPRIEALASRILGMDRAEDISAAIEAEGLPLGALGALADEVSVGLAGATTRTGRIAMLADQLARETRKGPGAFR